MNGERGKGMTRVMRQHEACNDGGHVGGSVPTHMSSHVALRSRSHALMSIQSHD